VQYVLESPHADVFLRLYFLTGIAFLPAWLALARRIGKRRAWLLSIAVNTGAFVGVFFLGPGDAAIYGVRVFFSGIGLGATLALPSSIQADVIDYDELLTGERREERYIGLWSIANPPTATTSGAPPPSSPGGRSRRPVDRPAAVPAGAGGGVHSSPDPTVTMPRYPSTVSRSPV